MAQIGSNYPLQTNSFVSAGSMPPGGIGQAGNLGFTAGQPSGLNYGGQVMSEVDLLVALIKLLAQGQTAPTGTGAGTAAHDPALKSAAGKGASLGKAVGKPAQMGQTLAGAGGKGVALKKAVGKTA